MNVKDRLKRLNDKYIKTTIPTPDGVKRMQAVAEAAKRAAAEAKKTTV